jgi:hypothetical protein
MIAEKLPEARAVRAYRSFIVEETFISTSLLSALRGDVPDSQSALAVSFQ